MQSVNGDRGGFEVGIGYDGVPEIAGGDRGRRSDIFEMTIRLMSVQAGKKEKGNS